MVSKNFKHWLTRLDPKTCSMCLKTHGKIYEIYETPDPKAPLHPFCRCIVVPMKALKAGTPTENKLNGADFWLKYKNLLPEYYITEEELISAGWERGKAPSDYVPERMVSRGIYENRNGHLPENVGRIWFEADINYKNGKRNSARILWSNDGLIFVTYDHYRTFCEII